MLIVCSFWDLPTLGKDITFPFGILVTKNISFLKNSDFEFWKSYKKNCNFESQSGTRNPKVKYVHCIKWLCLLNKAHKGLSNKPYKTTSSFVKNEELSSGVLHGGFKSILKFHFCFHVILFLQSEFFRQQNFSLPFITYGGRFYNCLIKLLW